MNVILQGDGKPFGVLEVDSRSEEEFVAQDSAFLQGAANILGMAIERERQDRLLKTTLARQEALNRRFRSELQTACAG
jgi:GAF domain-containing protein